MEKRNAGKILQEWFCYKKDRPQSTVEDFSLEKYLEFHKHEPGDRQEKTEMFRKHAQAWRDTEARFQAYAGEYKDLPELETWQGAEMLENVILELGMDEAERYRYLLNVGMMIGAEFIKRFSQVQADRLTVLMEQKYQEEWEKAEEGVTEGEFQNRFSETVALMKYAGIAYNDENRKILAEIGVGWQTEFQNVSTDAVEKDICFLMDFLVSEMVLSDWDGNGTAQEQQLIADQAVPVCVSSVSMVQTGDEPGHVMKLAYSYLGKVFTKKNAKLLIQISAVIMAAKAVWFLIKLAIAGKVIEIGLSGLWEHCREKLDLDMPDESGNLLLDKFLGRKYRNPPAEDKEEYWKEELEEFTVAEEYEHD